MENQNLIQYPLYQFIVKSRKNHGVATEDYDVYRKYLTKQLWIARKKFKLQCLDPRNSKSQQSMNAQQNKLKKERLNKIKTGKLKAPVDPNWKRKYKRYNLNKNEITWRNREITITDLSKNPECILILILLTERAWCYSVSIYNEYDEDNKRKYHHSNSRLRKAISYSFNLYKLLTSDSQNVDKSLLCQSFGYLSWFRCLYHLKNEEIEESFEQYLKYTKITQCLIDDNINDKLHYFEENITKNKRIEIEECVDEFIANLKQNEFGIIEEHKLQKAEYVLFAGNKVEIPNITKVKCLLYRLNELNKFCELSWSCFKRIKVFTSIVLMIESVLPLLTDDLKQYLLFEKLRFTICRQYLWYKNKNKSNILHELAVLSEIFIENLDELSILCHLSNNEQFVHQIDVLRNLFEISRKYYIAKIHYFWESNYVNAIHLFDHHIIAQSTQYISKFNQETNINKTTNSIYDFIPFIDINESKQMMQHILKDSTKLSMTAKALYVLNNNRQNKPLQMQWIDLKDKVYPMLTKPVMIDIAWNYIDYNTDIKLQTKKPQKQHSSWFGSIFGAK